MRSKVESEARSTARAVVTWAGAGEPIVLTVHGPEGEIGDH